MSRPCPTCGTPGAPLLYGSPDERAMAAAAAGELGLAGCLAPDSRPQWFCRQGHEWWGPDDDDWSDDLQAVLDRYAT